MQDRIKPFEGVRNFRDFGGYATPGGQIVTGRLFRSGHSSEASESDIAAMKALDFAFQVDLRRPDERDRQPNKWPAAPVEIISDDGGRESVPAHIAALEQDDVTPDSIEDYMVSYYREAPFRPHHVRLFRQWFERLAAHDGPALVNCAAGKDRTGIICALTHLTLGVSEDDVFEDYLLTNRAVDIVAFLPMARDHFNALLERNYDADVYRPFMGVRREYLETAFAAMAQVHGSPMGYAREALGVDADMQETLQRRLIRT